MDTVWNFITVILPGLIWYALRSLGMGVVSYLGLDYVFTDLSTWISNNWSGIPSDLVSILAIGGVDVCVKMVIAAYVVGFGLRGVVGTFKRLTFVG
jgi:hypothetical protein